MCILHTTSRFYTTYPHIGTNIPFLETLVWRCFLESRIHRKALRACRYRVVTWWEVLISILLRLSLYPHGLIYDLSRRQIDDFQRNVTEISYTCSPVSYHVSRLPPSNGPSSLTIPQFGHCTGPFDSLRDKKVFLLDCAHLPGSQIHIFTEA